MSLRKRIKQLEDNYQIIHESLIYTKERLRNIEHPPNKYNINQVVGNYIITRSVGSYYWIVGEDGHEKKVHTQTIDSMIELDKQLKNK